MTTTTPSDTPRTDAYYETIYSDCEGIEHARQLERELAAAQEALAAKNAALDFAEGAVEDAIYSEDGLEGDTGQRVIHIIQEARDRGTFDKEKFGDHLPTTRIELEAALAEARKLLHEMVDAWDNGVEDDSIIASRRTTDAFRKAREYLAAIAAREPAKPAAPEGGE